MALGLVAVTRPDGKVYRPRKRPLALFIQDDDWRHDRAYVYVMRTHDVDRARELANRLHKVLPAPIETTWVREAMRDGERVLLRDEVRGVPCVVFEVDEEV